MENFEIETQDKKINKKKIVLLVLIILLTISLISIITIYYNNKDVREWIDKNIFRKEIVQNNATIIELSDQNSRVYAFNKYIGILNKNQFEIYNNVGKKETDFSIEITNPIFKSSNRYLAIAENEGQKVYLIEDKKIKWETKIEGNILQIYVNRNGYVAVVITDANYKAVIQVINSEGEDLFKTFLSKTRISDVSISEDNKYLAIGEIDTTGTLIQSNVKIISIDKAKDKTKTDKTDSSIEHTYKSEVGKLLTDLKYQDRNQLVLMYSDGINLIIDNKEENLMNNENKKITFSSIELQNNCVQIQEQSSGLFTVDTIVNIKNTSSKKDINYTIKGAIKEIITKGEVIAINLGSEVEFINIQGMLIKRYKANQEITNITVSENMGAVIYRDKIELINL